MSSGKIDLSPDIDGFFEQAVNDAIRARQVEATAAAARYLAGILGDYARGAIGDETLGRPLTFQLRDALAAAGAERFRRLRTIGDGVLYVLGFFGASFTRRGADRDYVMQVGSSAYGHASAMLRCNGNGSAAPDVLGELAQKYGRFVEVMGEIADGVLAAAAGDDSGVLKIYERWQLSGSERLADELTQLGLFPIRAPGGVH
jgi:hypothetical protein